MQSSVRPVIKALGDDTRFRIYTWLNDQSAPATIAEIADHFDLHPNTVRPHLDRLREADLVELDASSQGSVGRPQHRYRSVPAELELHSDTDGYPVFTRMLASLCSEARVTPGQAQATGHEIGRGLAMTGPGDVEEVLVRQMERLGFDPVTDSGCVTFTGCPLRELAQTHPDLICSLHEGLVAGIAEARGGGIREFHDVQSSEVPCFAVHG